MLVVTAQMLSLAFPGFWKGKQWLLKWCNWKILLSLAGWEKHGSFWWFFSRRRGKVWQHHWGTGGRPVIHIWLEKENNHLSRKGCKHHVFTFCLGTFCDREEALYVELFCYSVKSYCNSDCVEKEPFRDRIFLLLYFSKRWLSHRSPLTQGRNHLYGNKSLLMATQERKAANGHGWSNINKCHGWCTE